MKKDCVKISGKIENIIYSRDKKIQNQKMAELFWMQIKLSLEIE